MEELFKYEQEQTTIKRTSEVYRIMIGEFTQVEKFPEKDEKTTSKQIKTAGRFFEEPNIPNY